MKKLFLNLAFVAVSMFVVISCSNGKTTETDANGESEEVEAVEVELDHQGVKDLMNSGKEKLTEDDVDFLLDQMEVIIKKTEGLTKDEYNAYLSALTGEEQEVVMMVAFGLAGLYFQLIMSMNGFSQPSLSSRHYRLEMIDHNEETGEFTAGILQAYSREYGWLNAGDKRLKKTTKGFLMEMYDSGMPINYFEGVAFKQSPKRDDVYWYPPAEWYGNDNDALQSIIDGMNETYRTNKSDYDEMFGL